MRKKLMLVLCLALSGALMAGCGKKPQEIYPTVTQRPNMSAVNPTQAPTAPSGSLDDPILPPNEEDYDPASEEDTEDFGGGSIFDSTFAPPLTVETPAPEPTINSQYAGASPVVIDPIDKPTPTPLPALTFAMQSYDATKLHLSFEAPMGWSVDDSSNDTYILTQPTNEAIPGYQSTITVRATTVNSQFDSKDMANEVKQMLETIGASGFKSFEESRTAERTLLDKAGVYANYSGVTLDGVEVAGRVHVTCINKVLYSVHMSYPLGYRDTYVKQVYNQFRTTVKITQ